MLWLECTVIFLICQEMLKTVALLFSATTGGMVTEPFRGQGKTVDGRGVYGKGVSETVNRVATPS
jgi:hypothetical protein